MFEYLLEKEVRMTHRALSRAFADAMASSHARTRLGVPLVAGVVIALVITSAGREPRFRELGLVVGG
jgi:hypothetical protein